jgi:CRP/FNR family transcriptional regulator
MLSALAVLARRVQDDLHIDESRSFESVHQIAASSFSKLAPIPCDSCAVRSRGLCAALSGGEIQALNSIATRKTLEDGEFFVIEGDPAISFANVISGVAKLTHTLDDGREQIVGLLFPSDFIGQVISGSHNTFSCTVQAAGRVQLCVYPASRFSQLVERFPKLEHTMLEKTQKELDTVRGWMTMLGRKTATERVATFLHHLAMRTAEASCSAGDGFDMPFTRADIADFTGLTYETVSRQITRLRKDGIIQMETPRRVAAVDLARLAECAGR